MVLSFARVFVAPLLLRPLPCLSRPQRPQNKKLMIYRSCRPSPTIAMGASKSPVEQTRIHALNHQSPDPQGQFVLYWMQNSVRTHHNPALEHAAFLSKSLEKPLRTVFLFSQYAADGTQLPERHASFLIDALQDVENALAGRNIPFAISAPPTRQADAIANLAQHAAAVVTDTSYLRPGIAIRQTAAENLKVPLIRVEADVVVPVEVASCKAEHAARTIRPKITRLVPDYLVPLEEVELDHQNDCKVTEWLKRADLLPMDVSEREDILSSLTLDRGACTVNGFRGGQSQAREVLEEFLTEKIAKYGSGRNEPAQQLQSDLSPYLRAGNISPVEIALRTKSVTKGKQRLKESESSFLEELIVRRELAVNACWFNPKYDEYESIVPHFAKVSLALHKDDKRPKIYSYEELEAGVTGDEFWNAAQLEMIVRGKMHGYMRMYWVKQIIGWVEDPVEAMDYALRLNNRWELDAVDPNSYVGVIWCFGLHDHGWTERPVWGKVRYMNESGLKRKFNMAAYVAFVDGLVAENGLPDHIKEIRKKHGGTRRQQTIQESMKEKRKSVKKGASKRAGGETEKSKSSGKKQKS